MVERDGDGGVSWHLGCNLRVDVLAEHEGCARMPRIVQADRWEAGAFEQGLGGAVAQVGRVDQAAEIVDEYETTGAVEEAHALHLL